PDRRDHPRRRRLVPRERLRGRLTPGPRCVVSPCSPPFARFAPQPRRTIVNASTETLQQGLSLTLDATDLGVGTKYEGKVRDNYTVDGERIIVVTDRISAFDRVLGTLPFKGQVLNSLAAFWFEETKDIVPNHVIDVPDPNVMIAVECEPLPIE